LKNLELLLLNKRIDYKDLVEKTSKIKVKIKLIIAILAG